MTHNQIIQTQKLLEKYKKYYENEFNFDLSKMPCKDETCYWAIVDEYPVQFMKCVICLKDKQRTPLYFRPTNIDFYKGYDNWVQKTNIGTESFDNNYNNGCRDCIYNKIKIDTNEFWKKIGYRYNISYTDMIR
jgi:hypothetical protein